MKNKIFIDYHVYYTILNILWSCFLKKLLKDNPEVIIHSMRSNPKEYRKVIKELQYGMDLDHKVPLNETKMECDCDCD